MGRKLDRFKRLATFGEKVIKKGNFIKTNYLEWNEFEKVAKI